MRIAHAEDIAVAQQHIGVEVAKLQKGGAA